MRYTLETSWGGKSWVGRNVRTCGLAIAILTTVATGFSADIYVDGTLGSTSCTTYNPATRSCSGGTATAYRTVAGGSSAAQPGDTVIIRAGSYPEQLRPARSGTANSRITYRNQGDEAVFLTPSSSQGMNLSDRSYLTITGLRVEDRTWLEAQNAHHNILQRCIFRRNPKGGTTGNVRFISSTYNQLLDNIIDDGNDNIVLIDSSYNLVQGNTITEGRHSVISIRCSNFNIIRSNYFANTQQKIAEIYDCGADTSAVPNSFNDTKHNLWEKNVFAEAVTEDNPTTSNGNAIQYGAQEGIVRQNLFYSCYVGLAMQNYGDESLYCNDNRVYHNVFFENEGGGIAIRTGTLNNIYKNNILYRNNGCSPDCDAVTPGQVVYRSPLHSSTRFIKNNIIYQNPGQDVMEVEFGSGRTLAEFASASPGILVDNLEVNPMFVDAAARDFRLAAGSPMINAGAFLTRTTAAGSGTTIPVEDAHYFYDGFGIPWETGDLIQLAGQTQPVRVVAVNYSARTVTVNQSVTWTAGQGVSLPFSGAAPDIGAIETSSGPTPTRPNPPTNLRVVPD